MIHLEADPSKNLLRITFSGYVAPDEAHANLEKVREALSNLALGFRLLADLSTLDAMDIACAEHLKTSMDICNEAGVSIVVRIIPDPKKDIGLNIMSKFHYDRDITIVTCETEAQAMKALAE
jgi:anti-anti-sigma regulatory factor